MRILFLTDNFPPEVNAPATRTYEHCREWVKLGAEVTVITGAPNFPQGKVYAGYKNSPKKVEYIDGIKVIRVWTYITANEGFLKRTLDYISFSVTSFFAGLFQRADIIIATSPQFFTALSGRTLSFWKRKPWIMEVRDIWPESIKTVGALSDNFIIKYFEREELRCYKSAKHIVVVTDSFKDTIVGKGIDPNKITVVKNGANLELFKPQIKNEVLISKLQLEGKFVLGYIGTHGMAHKLDFILDSAKKIAKMDSSIHFLLIGDGAEKQNLLEKKENEGITNVTMLDAVSKYEVVSYLGILDAAVVNLKKSDLFKTVIPSKIFESSAMGIPILLGVDGETRRIVEDFEAGIYYEPENINHFIDSIFLLKKNEACYIQFSNGAKRLADSFDRKLLAKEMYDCIKEII